MPEENEYKEEHKLVHNHTLYKELMLAEQVRQLYALAPVGFVATFVNSLIVFFVARDVISHRIIVPWLICIWTITLLRLALIVWFRSLPFEPEKAPLWERRFLGTLILIGSAWGSIGLFPFAEVSLAHQVFIAFVLGGMAAGASSTFSMVKHGHAAFSIPALVPLAVHFLLMNDPFHFAMAAMTILFGLLLWKISLHNYSINRSSLLLRFENRDMIERLKTAKDHVEGLNAELVAQIDARLKAEAELKRHHDHLERVVEERTANLSMVNRELEQFAYVASHDLQEPLRMISSYLQLLERKYKGRLDEKADIYIRFAVDGAVRMQRLIEGLLSYARLSTSTEVAEVDVNATFDGAVENLAVAIAESKAEVTRDDLPCVWGDRIQLQQLLQNLISNAIKYRNPHTPPRVHISTTRVGNQWQFSVRDNGIGIDPDHYERIFQIFQRLHTREEYPGTGIGLASCKKIVERHGGHIWLSSSPGEGSVFSFTIPADRQEPMS